jgi:hypothetical protein
MPPEQGRNTSKCTKKAKSRQVPATVLSTFGLPGTEQGAWKMHQGHWDSHERKATTLFVAESSPAACCASAVRHVSSPRPCSACSRAGCLSTTVPTPAATRRSTICTEAPMECFPTRLRRIAGSERSRAVSRQLYPSGMPHSLVARSLQKPRRDGSPTGLRRITAPMTRANATAGWPRRNSVWCARCSQTSPPSSHPHSVQRTPAYMSSRT